MKKFLYFLVFSLLFIPSLLHAQDTKEGGDFTVSSDIMSRYVWRGTAFSTTPSIQPCLEYAIGGFSIGAWGAYSFHGMDGAEADIYLSYTFLDEKLSVTVTDYFFPDETGAFNNYFEYDKDLSSHVFEASLSWNGTENFPLSVLVATNFYGADSKNINNDETSADFNTADGNKYSTYIELTYSMECKDTDLDIFAGFTPNQIKKPDLTTGYIGEAGFYGDTWGFVNLGMTASKEIKITDDFSLPVSSSLIVNPMAENIFLVFGISL